MTDNTGTKCIRCGKGHYTVFDLNDDIFGDLHCDNCRHHVKFNQDLRKCLSPQAQAVMNAYKEARDGNYINGEWIQDEAGQVAAALRAAADQVVPKQRKPSSDSDYHLMNWTKSLDQYYQRQQTRDELLNIADELENND